MLRRQARLRREYLYRKSLEHRKNIVSDRKSKLKKSLEEGVMIPNELRSRALRYQSHLQWDDQGPENAAISSDLLGLGTHIDDEYRWAGIQNPKIVITTSRDPSIKLKMFAKEVRLLFPNAQRMNRGNYEMHQLIDACRANNVTDFIILHEHRGIPDAIVICHLPFGPTAYFTLSNVIMRHDIPNLGHVSEQYPHLIFHNFTTKLGLRVQSILKYLFPVPKENSKRIMTFINNEDYIIFRHHTYKKGSDNCFELSEVGPRFVLKLYEIKLGTIEHANVADIEWVYRPYMNTARKKLFLSEELPWN